MLLQLSIFALFCQTRGVQKAGEKKGSAKTRLESFFSQDYFFFRIFYASRSPSEGKTGDIRS